MYASSERLPSEPQQLSVVNVSTHTISLMWKAPLRVPDPITSYGIQYKRLDEEQFIVVSVHLSSYFNVLQHL